MIANTYVVKPFGISEVKVIALKGEPGGPTQEQVNTAVEEYMDDHPEAQIPDGAVTTEKLASNTVTPYADNLVSSSYVSDSEPYLFRKTFAGVREDTEVVGGSVVWNQLCNSASVTIPNGRKYFMKKGTEYSIGASTGTAITGLTSGSDMVIDLTIMFGSTVADYIYSLETATAGAGVAFFRSLFSKPYYAYNAGTLISVNTSGHKMTSPDEETVTYPLSSIDLRGVPTIVDGKLKYDGDVYKSDGTVTRRYGIVDLGTLNWNAGTDNVFYSTGLTNKAPGNFNILCPQYSTTTAVSTSGMQDKECKGHATSANIYIRDTAYSDKTAFKTAMSGVYLVYELATPTTETTDPFTNPQVCYPDGTEEYIDTREVPIPVGHNTKYMRDLKKLLEGIPDAPSANGTYVLKATVSASGVTYAWVEG